MSTGRDDSDTDNGESLHQPNFSRKMQRSIRKVKQSIQRITENMQEEEKQQLHILPERLSFLMHRTGFSKNEIRKMYRAFKQCCPNGAVTSNDLKPAYAKLFPLGDPGRYTQIIFNTFDRDGDGIVTFGDLLAGMTLIIKGNIDEKLSWIFRFYDLNGDGCITRQEMMVIISAIYEMVHNDQTIRRMVNRHVDKLFEKMDVDKDGVISKEEFITSCKNDLIIYNQLTVFNNFWW